MEARHCHLCPHLLLHQLGLRCLNHTLLPSEADERAFNPTCESHGRLGASSHAELPSLFWFAWRTLTSRETLPLLVDSWAEGGTARARSARLVRVLAIPRSEQKPRKSSHAILRVTTAALPPALAYLDMVP